MEMVRQTGQMGVPVTFVGDKFAVGYDPDAINELLKENDLLD